MVPSAVAYILLFSAVGAWTAYATVLFADFGVGLAAIGVLASVPAAVAIVGAPAWGLVADRLGDVRPPLLVAGLWAAAAAMLLLLRPDLPWLAVVVILIAAGSSGLGPMLDARTVERLGRDRERFGQTRAFGSLSFVVSSVVVGILVQALRPEAMLLVYVPALALTGIVGAATLGRGTRTTRAAGVGPLGAVRMLRQPGMALFFAGSVIVWIAAIGVMAFFSLRLIELGGDARLAGIGWAATAALEIPTMLAFRRIALRVRLEWLLVIGAVVFAIRAVLWSIAGSATGLVVVAGMGGVGFGLFFVATTTFVAGRAPAHLRATAQALFASTTFAMGSIIGAVVAGGVAATWGLAAVFPVAAVASVAGAALIWLAVIHRVPGRARSPEAGEPAS